MNRREDTRRRLASPLVKPAVWPENATVGTVLRDIFGQVGVVAAIDTSADSRIYDSNPFFAGSHRAPRDVLEYLSVDFGWHFEVNDEGVVECWASAHG